LIAAGKLKAKIVTIASHALGVRSGEISLRDGKAIAPGHPSSSLTYPEIAHMAYYRQDLLPAGFEPGLEVAGTYTPPNIRLPDKDGRRNESPTYSNSWHIAAVEVDTETGMVKVLKYVTVHDSGTLINPAIVEGQVVGCVAQGLGEALLEELIYDTDGQLLSSSFMDYFIPTSDLIPKIEVVSFSTPSTVPGGFRGSGQSGSMATPGAITNAIEDALGDDATTINRFPMSPERVWRLPRNMA
jgi:CO/xanthine dehydrogenase Mo-binding subunit